MKTLRLSLLTAATGTLSILFSCQSEQLTPEVDCSTSNLSLQVTSTTDPSCGNDNGSIVISATGGESSYTFSLNGSTGDGTFENLTAGSYEAVVTDQSGCSQTSTIALTSADGVNIDETSVTTTSCGGSSGSISITASGGTTPYTYSIDGSSFGSESSFSNLASGTYEAIVKDANDCEFTETVAVLTNISFESNILPIIESNCQGCHGSGGNSPDLSTSSNIIARASSIKSATSSGRMPKNGSLPQSEIDMIACWADDVALSN